jgi:GH24 family phage-related lysozyme (muramidase)
MKPARLLAAALTLSAAGLVALTQDEGYTDQAVRPLPGDVPTFGFGSTRRADGSPVQMGDTTRPPQALALALRELRHFEGALHRCVTAPLTQGEFDSLVSLAYNVGADAVCRSTMVRLHLRRVLGSKVQHRGQLLPGPAGRDLGQAVRHAGRSGGWHAADARRVRGC